MSPRILGLVIAAIVLRWGVKSFPALIKAPIVIPPTSTFNKLFACS